jgi:hypothetical protein
MEGKTAEPMALAGGLLRDIRRREGKEIGALPEFGAAFCAPPVVAVGVAGAMVVIVGP